MEDRHIHKIADAYNAFEDVPGFAKVISKEDIIQRNSKLSIALYVRQEGSGEKLDVETIASDYLDDIANVRSGSSFSGSG